MKAEPTPGMSANVGEAGRSQENGTNQKVSQGQVKSRNTGEEIAEA
jgi:hypothetical protein